MLLSLAEPAEPAEKDEIDLWPEFRDRRILSTLHALRAEVFNNLHLYLLIIFMFSIASSFSVMLECLYRASMQFLSGNHVFLSCSNASIGHPCSFYRGTITSSGFPLKTCGNDSVVELSVLCPLSSVLCLLTPAL